MSLKSSLLEEEEQKKNTKIVEIISIIFSMSSGCLSENDENAFDVDYPDGGTIRRKTTTTGTMQTLPVMIGDTLPLPPPPQSPGDITPTDNGHPLPLPPPPLPLLEQQALVQPAIREEIYPCGVMRTRYPAGATDPASEEVATQNDGPPGTDVSQLSLLQQLPTQPPPSLHNLMTHSTPGVNGTSSSTPAPAKSGGRKITFSEYVHNLEESVFERLKGSSEEPEDVLKEQDVSNWVLDSLRHCSNGSAPASNGGTAATNGNANGHANGPKPMPKIYNGRTVPNCFSPEELQARQAPRSEPWIKTNFSPEEVQQQHRIQNPTSEAMEAVAVRKFPPPAPPMRSDGTYLTH